MDIFTVGRDSQAEIVEKKSRFIARSFFVQDEAEAVGRIDAVRAENPQASHNVYAYSLRAGGIRRCSDDGEPQGTAGMPVLKVIEFNALCDVCVVVTRYFGGILLGAGGLVRAYTRSAAEVIQQSGRARIVEAVSFRISCGYELSGPVGRALSDFGAQVTDTSYTDRVEFAAVLQRGVIEAFCGACADKFYSNVQITPVGSSYMRRPEAR